MSIERDKQALIETRNSLRSDLVKFPQIIEGDQKSWWKNTARLIINLKREIDTKPPEVQEYLYKYLPNVINILRAESAIPEIPKDQEDADIISLRTETGIVRFSIEMAESFDTESLRVHENITSLAELPRRHPKNFSIETRKIRGIPFIDLGVRPNKDSRYNHLLVPENIPMGQKGGGPRGVLDIDQDAPQSMIESEFPWNDIDAIGAGEQHDLRVVAEIMGIDHDGLEVFPGTEVDFSDFALGRDTTQNQVFLDAQGLHYSDEALHAAQTGHIEIVGGYKKNKAIYGKDLMVLDGITLAKPRGLMRLIKPVAEGKALDFDYIDMNNIMDFGVYYLFLGRKWQTAVTSGRIPKEKFGLHMQRMYHITKQMGQVQEGENNIMDVFERVHTQYPFYDMDKRIDNLRQLVQYMSGKLIKQIDREFGWTYGIPTGMEVVRTAGDDIPHKINLDGFSPSEQMNKQIIGWWSNFLKECRKRTDDFNSKPVDPLFRYFIKNEIQDSETEYIDDEQ